MTRMLPWKHTFHVPSSHGVITWESDRHVLCADPPTLGDHTVEHGLPVNAFAHSVSPRSPTDCQKCDTVPRAEPAQIARAIDDIRLAGGERRQKAGVVARGAFEPGVLQDDELPRRRMDLLRVAAAAAPAASGVRTTRTPSRVSRSARSARASSWAPASTITNSRAAAPTSTAETAIDAVFEGGAAILDDQDDGDD